MNIPIVKFRPMTLEENIETIKWAFFEDNGDLSAHTFTVHYFEELADLDINGPKDFIYKKIEEVVTKEYNNYIERIKSESKKYNNIWKQYNDKYFNELSKFFGTSFPKSLNIIDATVGLIPVFPRYLDEFSFSISTGVKDWKLVETTAHETLHFMWFEKWKRLHPETPRRHYDSPFIEWKYSEMVTDPILNNKPFDEMFEFKEHGYDSFYELHDDGELVMDKLRDIYSSDDSIEVKIEKGYLYLQNYLKNEDIKKI